MDGKKPRRRSIRLSNYNYSTPGAYFITICTYKRQNIFGKIVDNQMLLNQYGLVASEELHKTAILRSNIELDEYIVMPNHIHAILWIGVGTVRRASTDAFGKPVSGSLSSVVRSFKSAVTKRINDLNNTPGVPVWQRGYYEHVIRRDESLDEIRQYIVANPVNWATDPENRP